MVNNIFSFSKADLEWVREPTDLNYHLSHHRRLHHELGLVDVSSIVERIDLKINLERFLQCIFAVFKLILASKNASHEIFELQCIF